MERTKYLLWKGKKEKGWEEKKEKQKYSAQISTQQEQNI